MPTCIHYLSLFSPPIWAGGLEDHCIKRAFANSSYFVNKGSLGSSKLNIGLDIYLYWMSVCSSLSPHLRD